MAAAAFASVATPGAVAGMMSTVTISGKAYRFNHMDMPIPGATVKVREDLSLSTVTGRNGNYRLRVPNNRNITPYIVSGDYTPGQHHNEIDLQTFHPRGRNIENANFQTPSDGEYSGLKAILSVSTSADGRPNKCAIVTTSSARDVRGVDYQTFWDRTPHGVAGTTASEFPALDGPIYFSDSVIPDRTKTMTSGDGGIVWTEVAAGAYRITGSNPNTRFASFLATCAPGRIVNANPPWGMYELAGNEKPLAAGNVAGAVTSSRAFRKARKKRRVKFQVTSGEGLRMKAVVMRGSKAVTKRLVRKVSPGKSGFIVKVGRGVRRGKAKLKLTLTDASGISFTTNRKVRLPRVIRSKRQSRSG